ncbi:MAG: LemA family protein [Flavobacteriales bacterium]|nr:LemA family protein [Flavobacteriales bacterium]
MSKSTATLLLILFAVITFPIALIVIPLMIMRYNKIKRMQVGVKQSFSGMDVMLRKRFDLIPNLVESVKKIMSHEQSLLTEITALRSGIETADGQSKDRLDKESQLSALMGKLQISMENYPEIKSDQNMLQLQRTMTEMEEQISAARRAYNSNVTKINNEVVTFPGNIFAAAMEVDESAFFEATESERSNPNVGSLFGT